MTPPIKKAKKAAGQSARKGTAAAKKKKATKKSASSSKAPAALPISEEQPLCAGVTAKGTPCRFKARPDSLFCARHSAPEIESDAVPDEAPAEAMSLPQLKAEAMRADGSAATADVEGMADEEEFSLTSATGASETSVTDDESEEDEDEEMVLYGSVYSTTLEASPYDKMSPEMAEGAEEVELLDEHEFGHGARPPPRPQLSREEAEKKALEKIGPKPDIEPEEDLDGLLAAYDRRFEAEVRFQMGLRGGKRRRRRGRRGGRGRPGGPPPQREGGGWHAGGGGRGGRRGGGGGRRGGGGGGRPGPGPGSKVARDSPLAQRRGSSGPKRGVKPRRRREPDF